MLCGMPPHERGADLTVALVRDVFHDADGERRLGARLAEACAAGADLALLPEIPLDRWSPATRIARDEDAEEPGGRRHQLFARASRAAGIGIVGGAIVRDPEDGLRRNTTLVFDARGEHVAGYAKVHLPEEPGFWETSHYVPGTRPARVIDDFALPIGVQVCSDVNRPQGGHALAAAGALAILAPRATEEATYERWLLVFRANALTSCAYVLSVGRPRPEDGVPFGGPSVAIAPDGTVLLETNDAVAVVRLERAAVEAARRAYPGHLPVHARLYADAWDDVARSSTRVNT
jgi:predicted amidohydrolase